MGTRLQGKVALISGAARGQGREHALRLAEEGADIVAFDICGQLDTVGYPMATQEDLQETVARVEKLGRRIIARVADVRDDAAVRSIVAESVAELGRLDIVLANAGIITFAENTWSLTDAEWDEVITVNLTGVFRTIRAAVPAMIEAGNGGSIVITSSTAGLKGTAGIAHYSAAKHGVVGLARTLAIELAPHAIRVNTVHPTGVNTPMIDNEQTRDYLERNAGRSGGQNLLPVSLVQSVDVSNAILWLTSDEGRYVTGVSLPVDAGFIQR